MEYQYSTEYSNSLLKSSNDDGDIDLGMRGKNEDKLIMIIPCSYPHNMVHCLTLQKGVQPFRYLLIIVMGCKIHTVRSVHLGGGVHWRPHFPGMQRYISRSIKLL